MADEATIAKAREMGWFPKENFNGDPKDFIDADEFVSRGEKLMPILKANNRKLANTVKQQGVQLQQLSTQLTQAQKQLAEFSKQNLQSNLERLKGRKQQLLAVKVAAKQADDAAGETQAEEDLRQIDSEIGEATKALGSASSSEPPVKQPTKEKPAVSPAFSQWQAKNPWYGSDKVKTRYADGVAAHLRSDPENAGMDDEAFFDTISREVQSQFPNQRSTSKVEGGGNGSGNGGGSGGTGNSYSDLPSDAKAICDRQAQNSRLVGKGKQFETADAYKEHYVAEYFR